MHRRIVLRSLVLGLALVLLAGGAIGWYFRSTHTRVITVPETAAASPAPGAVPLPHPAHVVVVIEENKSFEQIVGNTEDAPYLNELAGRAAVYTRSYGITHPSQPNYFALFAGRINSDGDSCAVRGIPVGADNLGAQLRRTNRTFVGYAEGMPTPGFRACIAGDYARKHAPWTHFTNIPDAAIQPFTAFPRDYAKLPALSFVVPDLQDDMHSASISHGDAWLRRNIDPLIRWAQNHDTLVIVTWDESSAALSNHIPTLFAGAVVRPGRYDQVITHYDVLRTLEDLYGLPHAGAAASAHPVTQGWSAPRAPAPRRV
ncbi:MAG: phosphatidylinositol-3-phosphatase [Candidatus Eremiobacteraeota bacterium]|jgi:acid phosphatase|nr:phosphatidylinositol-3-phosphatase [Candidatus Eremiobacteraeota bacterium]